MKVSVWDTYVQREDGKLMHFDILVPNDLTDEKTVYTYGMNYLNSKPFATQNLTSKECTFCHIEEAPEEIIQQINTIGYAIIEMEHCDPFN